MASSRRAAIARRWRSPRRRPPAPASGIPFPIPVASVTTLDGGGHRFSDQVVVRLRGVDGRALAADPADPVRALLSQGATAQTGTFTLDDSRPLPQVRPPTFTQTQF